MKFYANLYLHSTHSDGKYTPAQLAETAYNEGYRAASVTDHDTATAYGEFKAVSMPDMKIPKNRNFI